MTYLCFLAQAAICSEAIDQAFPKLREAYPTLEHNELLETVRDAVWDRQVELRDHILGISPSEDSALVHRLAAEIPKMYEEAIKR